LAANAGLTEPG